MEQQPESADGSRGLDDDRLDEERFLGDLGNFGEGDRVRRGGDGLLSVGGRLASLWAASWLRIRSASTSSRSPIST